MQRAKINLENILENAVSPVQSDIIKDISELQERLIKGAIKEYSISS